MKTNRQILLSFFEAENQRDWSTYRKYIADDIVWECHSSGKKRMIEGAYDYIAYMQQIYEKYPSQFEIVSLYESADENRLVAILLSDTGIQSCDIFDFSDGLIIKEYEFTLDIERMIKNGGKT